MNISKLWAYGVAYVSLAVGAGLSIAGNVADTFRTTGPATDALDIALAMAWPALVLLCIEMFVSTLWPERAAFQALRWIGSLAIGGMAMRVSWIHLNDLLASRGQAADVAMLGPLAIDGMAIMATALILAGRRTVATSGVATLATGPASAFDGLATSSASMPDGQSVQGPYTWPLPTRAVATDLGDVLPDMATVQWTPVASVPPLGDDLADAASFWTPERQAAARAVATEIDTRTAPVVPGRSRRLSVDEKRELAGFLQAAAGAGAMRSADVDALLAAHYGVSPRTIRRARSDAGISPVSAPPAGGVN